MKFIAAMNKAGIGHESKEFKIRVFRWVDTESGYFLSIQCSKNHYCYPRETIELDKYEDFELAIMGRDTKFLYPNILKDFNRNSELESYFDGSIFSYVPKDLVEDLYIFLNRK